MNWEVREALDKSKIHALIGQYFGLFNIFFFLLWWLHFCHALLQKWSGLTTFKWTYSVSPGSSLWSLELAVCFPAEELMSSGMLAPLFLLHLSSPHSWRCLLQDTFCVYTNLSQWLRFTLHHLELHFTCIFSFLVVQENHSCKDFFSFSFFLILNHLLLTWLCFRISYATLQKQRDHTQKSC